MTKALTVNVASEVFDGTGLNETHVLLPVVELVEGSGYRCGNGVKSRVHAVEDTPRG